MHGRAARRRKQGAHHAISTKTWIPRMNDSDAPRRPRDRYLCAASPVASFKQLTA